MELYAALAAEYSEIFPSPQDKVDFIESYLDANIPLQILDIGCASGEFASQLSGPLRKITGIDLSSHMVDEAQSNSFTGDENNIRFLQADMTSFLEESAPGSFDMICCLGNTIVYLDGESELKNFLTLAAPALTEQGKLIIQILNYGNPEIGPGFSFPPIETQNIFFERAYTESESPVKLNFTTQVKIKKTEETHTDIHRHCPFMSKRIEELSLQTGFRDSRIFGGYDKREAALSDFFHLLVIEK